MGYKLASVKIVIVGGVAGGMSAATRLRRLSETDDIVVFERSGYVSFANCGLPYYIGGVIEKRKALLLQTPASLATRFNLDVRVSHEVIAIDREAQTVRVKVLGTGAEFDESYDVLILSPGASAFVPSIPGADKAFPLRNVEDVDRLEQALEDQEAHGYVALGRPAVVMGGGFIGLETAENLAHRGWRTTVVELADQVMAPFDPEMAELVEKRMVANGVNVITGTSVTEIRDGEVTLSNGDVLPADVVVAAIGVRPEDHLARNAGLELHPRGGIIVDEKQRTNDPNIYAVGDAVLKIGIDGEPQLVTLANPANRQGRLVADVIHGRDDANAPSLGTGIVGVFGLAAASTGWSEKRARAEGRAIRVIHTHPADHAGYYPGAVTMALKLIVDAETDDILGAQGVGEAGVDKRIDVIATAMRGGIKASDLVDLELSYAPPFGSAKDPVNMLGYVADNLREGLTDTIQWHELDEALAAGTQLVDVRTPQEFEAMPIPGAVNVPLDELRERLDEVEDGAIVHCQVGLRGYLAARILAQHGKQVRNLDGGYRTWARL